MSHPNIQIRPYQPSDAGEVYQAVRESLPQVSLWLPDLNEAITLEIVQAYIAIQPEQASKRQAYNFVIFDADDLSILGGCGLTQINWQHGYANLYYWVRTSKAGRGVASSATMQLARYGIQSLGLQRIEIVVAAGNLASLRVAEKVGAEREGLLRNRIHVNDEWHDAFMHSLIPSDLDKP
jgi:RimJ/RimL family protein N-acetyltransferase